MINANEKKFSASQCQRCIKHKMENVLGYISEKYHEWVRPEFKTIFYQSISEKADHEVAAFIARYNQVYQTAIECLKRDL